MTCYLLMAFIAMQMTTRGMRDISAIGVFLGAWWKRDAPNLVSEVEDPLGRISEWSESNLVQFTPLKTHVCAFTAKKDPFVVVPQFQVVSLKPSTSSPLTNTWRRYFERCLVSESFGGQS
ncbi:uncharacterized protein LOC114240549 [Bombyx mandarina]|uniref:Uncharacterized protein LOC114240549 n=1 Tax=Bombyx mandarina TaxID=7092 RepID=A0A6J2JBX5_BOMMA|nr:uncharacterized protein LOC114240549 [Bombyx mandarina]